jgi:hypothetical protein
MKRIYSFVALAALSFGAVALPAASAYAKVHTSYINYNTLPPEDQSIACNAGRSYVVEHPNIILDVQNNCSYRIYLHQYSTGGGKNVCISPNSHMGVPPFIYYRQLLVTSNPAPC